MALAYEEQMKLAAEASARLKKSYLLRHIPIGLYYKPGYDEFEAAVKDGGFRQFDRISMDHDLGDGRNGLA